MVRLTIIQVASVVVVGVAIVVVGVAVVVAGLLSVHGNASYRRVVDLSGITLKATGGAQVGTTRNRCLFHLPLKKTRALALRLRRCGLGTRQRLTTRGGRLLATSPRPEAASAVLDEDLLNPEHWPSIAEQTGDAK